MWKSKNISLSVKVKLYESLVISTLLYGSVREYVFYVFSDFKKNMTFYVF